MLKKAQNCGKLPILFGPNKNNFFQMSPVPPRTDSYNGNGNDVGPVVDAPMPGMFLCILIYYDRYSQRPVEGGWLFSPM